MEARNFTTNVLKILDLKSSSEQIFFRKLSLGAPDCEVKINLWSGGLSSLFVSRYPRKKKNTWSQVKLRNAGTLSKFWHWEQFCFSPVHVGKIAKKTAWYVVPFSATSGLVFIIITTGVVILLLRRWRSTRKSEEPMDGEEMEMNEQAITPRKTKVRWECLPILKTPKETPAVVWNKPRHLFILWKSAWELLIKLFRGTREVLAKLHVLKMLGTIQTLAKEIYRQYCIALGKKRMFLNAWCSTSTWGTHCKRRSWWG